jgi:hypothetical protein
MRAVVKGTSPFRNEMDSSPRHDLEFDKWGGGREG